MVILDLASRISSDVRVFTLDTGRLPDETYRMMETVRQRYGIPRRSHLSRNAMTWNNWSRFHGPNLFYSSVPARQRCCDVRKVRPLERKLETLKAWATGLRRDQAETRAAVPKVDQDRDGRDEDLPAGRLDAAQVEEYIAEHDVPVHPLYARGYTSIGCAPCTRAVAARRERARRPLVVGGGRQKGVRHSLRARRHGGARYRSRGGTERNA